MPNRFFLTALRRNQPCPHLDLGPPASGAGRRYACGKQCSVTAALTNSPTTHAAWLLALVSHARPPTPEQHGLTTDPNSVSSRSHRESDDLSHLFMEEPGAIGCERDGSEPLL